MNDHVLDALLAEYAPPPAPKGLAERVAAAALALPQAPRPVYARRAPRDRRGSWLRRPMVIGGIALGLAVSGAVAATLAGVRLDRLPIVEAMLARLPLTSGGPPAGPAPTPPRPAPPAPELVPIRQIPPHTPPAAQPPAPRTAPARDAQPPVALAVEPPRADIAVPRPIEPPPAPPPLPPAPAARGEGTVPSPDPAPRSAAPRAGEEARLQQERIERAERLRAARQAQIERLQRIQQRRERIRRLRRD